MCIITTGQTEYPLKVQTMPCYIYTQVCAIYKHKLCITLHTNVAWGHLHSVVHGKLEFQRVLVFSFLFLFLLDRNWPGYSRLLPAVDWTPEGMPCQYALLFGTNLRRRRNSWEDATSGGARQEQAQSHRGSRREPIAQVCCRGASRSSHTRIGGKNQKAKTHLVFWKRGREKERDFSGREGESKQGKAITRLNTALQHVGSRDAGYLRLHFYTLTQHFTASLLLQIAYEIGI